jgi:hypothetical protein
LAKWVADEAKAVQCVEQMKLGRILPLTEDLSLEAALVSLKHKLPLADSMIYASAVREGAWIWTQDEHFRSFPHAKTTFGQLSGKGVRQAAYICPNDGRGPENARVESGVH